MKTNLVLILIFAGLGELFSDQAGAPRGVTEKVVFRSAEEAVDFATQNSRTWMLRRQEALANMKAAKLNLGEFLPSFSFSLNEMDSTAILAGDSRTKSIQASVNQKLFDGGKTKLAYETSRISSRYAYQEYEGEFREFRSGIISQYYRCISLEEMAGIREELLSAATEQLGIIRRETELGLSLETDYLEYLASYIAIEHQRDQSLRDLKTQGRRFKDAIELDRAAELEIRDEGYRDADYFYYEPYFEFLWRLVKNGSVALKKQNLATESARNQIRYKRRWYVPSIAAQGSVSFTGGGYPLTEPRYSVKLIFDFSNLNLLSVNTGPLYGFERDRLYQVNNGVSADIRPNPVYGVARKQEDIALLRNSIGQASAEKELEEELYELVISHDSSLRSAATAGRTIEVLEKRVEFSRLLVEQGQKKRIDFLNELIDLSQAKISLREQQIQAAALERALEISAGFPFGGLKNACLSN